MTTPVQFEPPQIIKTPADVTAMIRARRDEEFVLPSERFGPPGMFETAFESIKQLVEDPSGTIKDIGISIAKDLETIVFGMTPEQAREIRRQMLLAGGDPRAQRLVIVTPKQQQDAWQRWIALNAGLATAGAVGIGT